MNSFFVRYKCVCFCLYMLDVRRLCLIHSNVLFFFLLSYLFIPNGFCLSPCCFIYGFLFFWLALSGGFVCTCNQFEGLILKQFISFITIVVFFSSSSSLFVFIWINLRFHSQIAFFFVIWSENPRKKANGGKYSQGSVKSKCENFN